MKTVSLAEICTDVSYGYTASAENIINGVKFLRITDIQGGVVKWSTVPSCKISDAEIDKYRLHDGDIVIARTGNSTGENYIFHGDRNTVYASYLIRFRPNKELVDPDYIWFSMRSKSWWDFVDSVKTGSAQAGANAQVLGKYPINLPDLNTQKEISKRLKTIYDKIELNNQMNETLEAMAKAIFKEWFIDFGPVRAKAEGRRPFGMDDETAALFPDSFEESELGMIPKGWRVGTISEICNNPRDLFKGNQCEAFSYLGLEHLPQGSISLTSRGNSLDVVSNKFKFKNGDVLFGKLRPYFKKVVPAPFDGVCSTDILVLRGIKKENNSYVLFFTSSDPFIEFNTQASQGTKMPRTSWEIMNAYKIVIPDENILIAFDRLVDKFIKQLIETFFENQTLTNIRDIILPKLISGELILRGTEW